MRIALLPEDVTSKVFPPLGGLLLIPEVQTILVAVTETSVHTIPSMTTAMLAGLLSKLVPVIVIAVPPTLGPKVGEMFVTVDVFES